MNAVTTFPFYTLDGWNMDPPEKANLPLKGDTIIGNDVWIGPNATVSSEVRIGDQARVNLGAVAASDVPAGTAVTGNFAVRHDMFMADQLNKLRSN